MGIRKIEEKYTLNADKRAALVALKGKGAILTDILGDKYADFTAGKYNPLGYKCKKWERRVKGQLKKFSAENYYSRPVAEFSKAICRKTKMKRVFLAASADAANESAFLAARKYSFDKYGAERFKIAVIDGDFHGYSFAALSASDTLASGFGPKAEGFVSLPDGDIAALEQALDNTVCALALEIFSRGECKPKEKAYLEKIAALCREKDVLLIVNETNLGLGITGQLFSYMNFGLSPDIVTAAEGFGGPLAVALFGEKAENALSCGLYGAQQGGNPALCAGATYLLNAINEKLLVKVRENGKRMKEILAECENIGSFEGLGMLIGFLAENEQSVFAECMERGLIVGTANGKIVLSPPLNIEENVLENGLHVLSDVLSR